MATNRGMQGNTPFMAAVLAQNSKLAGAILSSVLARHRDSGNDADIASAICKPNTLNGATPLHAMFEDPCTYQLYGTRTYSQACRFERACCRQLNAGNMELRDV